MQLGRLLRRASPWGVVAVQTWVGYRLVMQHGRALLEQDRLNERVDRLELLAANAASDRIRSPQGSRTVPAGSTTPPAAEPSVVRRVRVGQLAHYQRLQDVAIRSVPPYPSARFAGGGIVILAGGPRYYTNAWVCLTMLRRVLDCRLPIQVWYLGPHEMSPGMIELLQRFDVECVDALADHESYPMRVIRGWAYKPFAMLHSPFKDVIFLDADNVPLIDPAIMLSSPEYRATGALFWPDLRSLGQENPIWEICRVSYRDEPEFETGQMVIDKERCWSALHLTLHLNEHADFYYRHTQGDKETFHMAWRKLDQPYSMPTDRPYWVVGSTNPGDPEFASVLQQRDFTGRTIFHHRSGAKWTAWGQNFSVPGFAHEAACLEALRELRQLWDGHVDLGPAMASARGVEAELLQARYFLYRRVGADERVLALLPGQRVGDGGSLWEQRWRLEREGGRWTLLLLGRAGVTCKLGRDADGVWRGHWLLQERLPVELRPLAGATFR